MLAKVLQARAMARAAVVGLAVGLVALASLAIWSTRSTHEATTKVRQINQISDAWGQVFQRVNLEDESMHDYLHAIDSRDNQQAFKSTLGGANPYLDWLDQHGGAGEAALTSLVRDSYSGYESTLAEMIRLGSAGQSQQVLLRSPEAELGASSVRKQISANIDRKRLEMTDYLDTVEHKNHTVRTAATFTFGIDFGLLLLCSVVLLGYQRRIEKQAEASRYEALHDSLTGLANRVLLGDRTDHALRTAARHREVLGLLLLDLDRFKEVNDTLGHHSGDLLLKEVANRLTEAVRDVDTVARLGGDEFAVLLPRVGSAEEAQNVANRVRAALCQPINLDGLMLDVNGSIGVSVYPDHSADATQLLQHADIAMYAAKRGQLGVSMYDSSLDEHSPQQLSLLGELRRAIDEGELVLHYQPKAATETGQIRGVEALVRWEHPRRGLLGPMEFIPLAEQGGLIEDLTQYVLTAALDQCRSWLDEGLRLPVAVNIAARCLLDKHLATNVTAMLAARGLDPGMLTMELTESAIMTDPDRALEVLGRIRQAGIKLSIDDFGTGYSSMAYLRNLPVNELKIDRCFVTSMQTEGSNQAIVRAVLELARNLGLDVVAEGVEDADTWSMLGTLGCTVSQGYYLSRPLPAAAVAGWVAEQAVRIASRIA